MKEIKEYLKQHELRCQRYQAIKAYIRGDITREKLTYFTRYLIEEKGLKQEY